MEDFIEEVRHELERVRGARNPFDIESYLAGHQSPVYFGSAVNNFGISELLADFIKFAPGPQPRETQQRIIKVDENDFSGFVFTIQANMYPNHRDRIAFLRICSRQYRRGMKVKHWRIYKEMQINNAVTFIAGQRENLENAYPGDILGLHNHGTIQMGDTFSQSEL